MESLTPIRDFWLRLQGRFNGWRHQRRDLNQLSVMIEMMAEQNLKQAQLVSSLQARLAHHEKGPLQASRERFDANAKSGVILPIHAKQPRSRVLGNGNGGTP